MRTLSVKLTKNFENISKHADKSRFFSELHSPLEIKTTRIINFKLFFLSPAVFYCKNSFLSL